jgi:MGT family glycosyltransferase
VLIRLADFDFGAARDDGSDIRIIAEDDKTPLVLVSFSTGFEQRNVDKVQRALDALAGLPVHAVATTGGIVAPNELAAPANAVVLNYAAHDPIIRRSALVVTHGGHGTAMRALRHGVPMVVIPGLAGDQPYVAAAVQEFGAGRALPADAAVEAIRAAAQEVLAMPSFKENARKRSAALAGIDGAANAADEIETLLKLKPAAGHAHRSAQTIACQQVA